MRLLGLNAGWLIVTCTIASNSVSAQVTERQKLYSSDPAGVERLGTSVAIDGDWMAAGCPRDAIGGSNDGSVFVYKFDRCWGEAQKLVATSPTVTDFFGDSVEMDNEVLVVGAPGDDEGVGGSGAAYVFRYEGDAGAWLFEQKLKATDAVSGDALGEAVAVSGDLIVAGATDSDGAGSRSGSVAVFRYDGSQWVHEQTLTASDAAAIDLFGASVAVSGERIVVGASNKNGGAGAVYVFDYDGSTWNETANLQPADLSARDRLGTEVQLDGDVLISGSHQDDTSKEDAGSARIYRYDGATWNLDAFLTAPTELRWNEFGVQVAILGDRAAIGVTIGEGAGGPGGVHLYRYTGGTWVYDQLLEPKDGAPSSFGSSDIDLSGDRVLVGRLADDDLGGDAGAVSIFDSADSAVRLAITPRRPSTGDPMEVLADCGEPDTVFMLALESVDGVPQFMRVLIAQFGTSGAWNLSTSTPPGLSGVDFGFIVIGTAIDGTVSVSNSVVIDFQ